MTPDAGSPSDDDSPDEEIGMYDLNIPYPLPPGKAGKGQTPVLDASSRAELTRTLKLASHCGFGP